MTALTLADGPQTLEHLPEIQAVYSAAFPGYDLNDHRARTTSQASAPGFAAVLAHDDGHLVGVVYGLPLSAGTSWWHGLEPAPADGWATETGSRTFALIDVAVLPTHRGEGVGRRLVNALLAERPEARATLATNPARPEVQAMWERWGWKKVGRAPGGPGETQPWYDLYVLELPATSSR
ncbi:hypothetical protein GCM10022221_57280 [Actinocorallia aurea]